MPIEARTKKDGSTVYENKKGKSFSEEDILGKVEGAQRQVDFFNQTGLRKGKGDKASRQLANLTELAGGMGLDISGIDRIDFANLTQEDRAELFRENFKNKDGGMNRLQQRATFDTNMNIAEQEAITARDQQFYEEEVDPEFAKAEEALSRLEEESFLNEQILGQFRSGVIERVKGMEESRLHRVSAVLGMRGLDPGSPAGAALAASTAEETDAMFAKEMRDLGIQVKSANSAVLAQQAQLRSNLALQHITARNQSIKGSEADLMAMKQGLAGFYQSLEQQRQLREMMKELMDSGAEEPSGLMGSLMGGAQGFMTGMQTGNIYAGIAGGVGGAVGGYNNYNETQQILNSLNFGGSMPGFGGGGGSPQGPAPQGTPDMTPWETFAGK